MEAETPRRPETRRALWSTSSVHSRNLPGTSNEAIDEEQERTARRTFVAIQKRLTNATSSSAGSPLKDVASLLGDDQIEDHLRFCAQLYTANKISSKNAWKLHVIDVMRNLAFTNTPNVLQVAGTSLDIGAKIYGLRVDDVHAKSLQLASYMNRAHLRQAVREEEAELVLQLPTRICRRRTKKMATDKRNTIDKDEKSLFGSIKPTESAVLATKENIDFCATDNLFSQKLPMNPATRQLMIMCDEKYWIIPPDTSLKDWGEMIEINLPEVTNYILCVPFKNFEIGAWSAEEEERFLSAQAFYDLVLDEHGIPIVELDGLINDIFEFQNGTNEEGFSDTEDVQPDVQRQFGREIDRIADAVPEENRLATEYGYNTLFRTNNGKYIDKLWAGPSHWRVRFIRGAKPRYSGSTDQQQVVRQAKKIVQPKKIDFSLVGTIDFSDVGEYVPKKTPITMPFDRVTLPTSEETPSNEDFMRLVGHLSLKPEITYSRTLRSDEKKIDNQVAEFTHDDSNDSLHSGQLDSDDINEFVENSVVEVSQQVSQRQFLDSYLVNAPELVSLTYMPYAMQAKKVDMKRLKMAVWKSLFSWDPQTQREAIQVTRYSEMYRKLPQFLPPEMKRELTPHLAVVALLHLCNDHRLQLLQDGNHDFMILKGDP